MSCWIHTFLFLALTETLDMNLFRFPEFSAVFALRDWAPLLLDFEKGSVSVSACARTMSFDACFAEERVHQVMQ